ncbi:heavy metal translocating P-type ATPase [Lentibacillus cibarius]|uniref:Heavy metal translocating P-type ATPase n=1 Tax=Lentibacillus cibarius TaxID=2583219 RepID=A0A549YIC8_9BACI|nr:heavy metal translocating P-type ATPase [Lentibacillus cibarius]TRM11620.1 heavy metal translocating P-type ATPase [Lentibacillus cibarius]
MGADLQALKQTNAKKTQKRAAMFHKVYEHSELIAALVSGLIILIAWSLEGFLSPVWWVILHLTAFTVGGYAKAKEGIQETIKNKDLNVELLMIIAAIGAAAIGYWTEGAILIFIFALSGALETYTMNKSSREISSLMKLQPEEATKLTDGEEELVPVSALEVGDHIFVRAGERIPADGMIVKGSTSVDESAITGESVPVNKANDNDVFAGTVALDGSITVKITKPSSETLFQKIIQLVHDAQDEKSPSQLFIERFEGTYVKVVLAVVAIMMFLPTIVFGWSLSESIYRAMILLVVASPCALVASIMPATLSAISSSAKKGVLFKGGVHVENLSNMNAVAFDKTGTLTNGKPKVTDVITLPGTDHDYIIAAAGAIEKESTHPLALAMTAYASKHAAHDFSAIPVTEVKTVSGNGLTASIDGVKWEIGKASFVGAEKAAAFHDGAADQLADEGKTIIFVKAKDTIVAMYALKDTIRKDTKKTISALKKQGIHTIMLTGDNKQTANAIAKEAGVDEFVAECLPEEKVDYLKQLRQQHEHVAMVGDGINDAPALAAADLGIAMGEGTDVALETADVVLMKNELPKITNAMNLSERMNRVIKQNIVFSLAIIGVLIISNFTQLLDLPLGVVGHEGSTILVILNGLRLLKA